MSRNRRSCLLPLLAAAMVMTRPAAAQLGCSGTTCTVEIRMPVTEVLRLSLSNSGVALGTPAESDFDNGYKDVVGPAVTATVKANRPFQLQLLGGSPTLTYSGPLVDPLKPMADLFWATSQAGLATTANSVAIPSMLMNESTGGVFTADVYLRTLWTFTRDIPGTYSATIRFTLSAP